MKQRIWKLIATVVIVAMSMLLFSGLHIFSANVLAYDELQNVNISSEGILSWDLMPGVTEYSWGVGGAGGTWRPGDPELNLFQTCEKYGYKSGTYDVYLYGYSGVRTEKWTSTYTYTASKPQLPAPANLSWNGNIATWDAVTGAEKYYVFLYQDGYSTGWDIVSTTSIDFTDWLSEGTHTYYFKVKAKASGYPDSELAKSSETTLDGTRITTLNNVSISAEGILSWDLMTGVTEYSWGIGSAGGTWRPGDPELNLFQTCEKYGFKSGTYDVYLYGYVGAKKELWTSTYTYTASKPQLPAPTNLSWNGNIATWDAVTGAEKYVVFLFQDGNSINWDNISTTSMDFTDWLSEGTHTYYFTVRAKASGYPDSEYAKSSEINNYSVIYDTNGHGIEPALQTVRSGDKAIKPSDLTASGFTFGGWYSDSACTKEYDFDSAVTTDLTLYAKWKPNYTVTFNANGNGIAPASQTVVCDSKATKPSEPTASEFTFGGWYTDSACTTAYDFNSEVTADITLYAKWTATPTTPPTPAPEESEKSFEDFVERLYTVALGRASEPEGKAFWCEHVGNGDLNGAQCANEFLLSKEFKDRGLDDEQFLEVLYKTFFNREAKDDKDGFNFWMNCLKTQGRDSVVDCFINSEEWCNVCASYGVKSGATRAKATIASKNATAFATRLYTECLGREPEEGGLKFWSLGLTNLELTGKQAAHEFFFSKEFNDFGLDNKGLLTRMYTTFMGRQPDDDGMNYWLKDMNNGMNKEQVFECFVNSAEFTQICKDYAIERG